MGFRRCWCCGMRRCGFLRETPVDFAALRSMTVLDPMACGDDAGEGDGGVAAAGVEGGDVAGSAAGGGVGGGVVGWADGGVATGGWAAA